MLKRSLTDAASMFLVLLKGCCSLKGSGNFCFREPTKILQVRRLAVLLRLGQLSWMVKSANCPLFTQASGLPFLQGHFVFGFLSPFYRETCPRVSILTWYRARRFLLQGRTKCPYLPARCQEKLEDAKCGFWEVSPFTFYRNELPDAKLVVRACGVLPQSLKRHRNYHT